MRVLGILFLLSILSACSQSKTFCFNSKCNELIKGFPNPVTIVSNGKLLEVTIDKGTIEKENDNNYTIIPGDDTNAIVTVRTRKKTERFYFKVREQAKPIITFGGEIFKETDSISAKRFRLSRPDIWLWPDAICSDISYRITNMTIIRIDKNKNMTHEFVSKGSSKLMQLAEAGDTYIFMDVKIALTESSKKYWTPITRINIKD